MALDVYKKNGGVPLDIRARFNSPSTGDQYGQVTNADGSVSATDTSTPKSLQIYPWWLYKPPTGMDVNNLGQVDFISPGVQKLDDCKLQLDQNQMGIIREIDIYIDNMAVTSDITFAFLVNGSPIPGYGKIPVFPRTAVSVSAGFDTFIYLTAGALLEVTATVGDSGAYLVGVGYQGWLVPTNIDSILGISGGTYTSPS